MATKIGYARISTKDQKLDRQIEALSKTVSKLFVEKESGATLERPVLLEMLNFIREGDIVVVTELDRLSRNHNDISNIMNSIQNKGATLEVQNLPSLSGIEDESLRKLINNLIIEIYKYQAESERTRIRERQQQGIEIAKQKNKYNGRKPLFNKESPQLKHAFDLYLSGESDAGVASLTGIDRSTFRRYRKKFNVERID
ncbi:recombinase family protein [Ruoffia tabacinasalis]|uniref:Recombinase family protein n=1 Tax=Ruoffia tabacinasalis TaxID=87458 RepID=A0A5R9EGG1_9LACT|nr:recombinase family protein [Ruoffia tabacinasalis]TLQ49504.1 recombinase family protein [Ruoffia tabacinasalis]